MHMQRRLRAARGFRRTSWSFSGQRQPMDPWGRRSPRGTLAAALSVALAVVFAATFGGVSARAASASTLVVTNLNDSGAGSLRDAITQANNEATNPGRDNIAFRDGLTG